MKKIFAMALVLALALSMLAGCGQAAESGAVSAPADSDKELNLYTWEGMFTQEILDGFTEETGIKINYSGFDSNETMLSKLETTQGGEYDIVLGDDYILEMVIQEGLAMPLDKAQIPNIANVNPLYQGQYYDPEDTYVVPYGAGIEAIVYSPERVGFEIKSFDDLTNPALEDSIGVVNNARFIYGASLLEDGESVNAEEPEKIEKAAAQVLEMAPNIRLIKEYGLQDDIVSGEIDVAITYTSEVTQAVVADPSLQIVYSDKGLGFGVMGQFIPAKAPHPEAAHKFMDYLLRPEISKQCFEAIGYYSTNKAADELIDEALKPFLTLPENVTIEQMDMMHNISAQAMDLHTQLWTEFRAACGQEG